MRRSLQGLRILITGASGGIGASVAEQAVRQGARVVLAARSADRLEARVAALSGLPGEALAVPVDITAPADRQRLLDTCVECLGGLDVLINNAGVGSFGHFIGGTEAILRQIMEVNFFAPAELIRLAVPILARGNQPAIVNISSMCGRRGIPAWSEYSASKFALVGFSEALRAELVRFHIDVLVILPGLTRSELGRHLLQNTGRMDIPFDRGMLPEKVASGILGALRRNRAETVLGWDARWMLRLTRFVPRLVDYLLARRIRQLYAKVC
jgi:short-subunit dehydrogenase